MSPDGHSRPAANQPAVLVTGSSGLLGQPVAKALAQRGFRVFALDRSRMADNPNSRELADGLPSLDSQSAKNVEEIEIDMTDANSLRTAVDQIRRQHGAQLESVIHLAAYYDFSGEDSPLYQRVTVNGTDRLLNALKDFELGQFVFSSTMLVHAPAEVGKYICEHSPMKAKWPYPQSKIDTERLIAEKYADVPSVFLRIAGVYTDWGTQPTLVQQIKRIYERDFQSHFFPGDMRSGQSAVHLEDTVDAILRTVEFRDSIESRSAILIGESDPPSYEELQDYIGRAIHGDDWTTLYVPPLVAKAGAAVTDAMSGGESFIKPFMVEMADDHYALDISRAEQWLGWRPTKHLRHVLPTIIRHLLDNPQEWYARNGLSEPQEA